MARIKDATFRRMIRICDGQLITCSGGSFRAVFDNETFVDSVGTETTAPVLTCATADATRVDIRKGAQLDVGGSTYKVRRHELSGDGMSRLILEQ